MRVRTLAGIPTGIPPLVVSHVRAHQASFEWGEPEVAHGPIETYVLQVYQWHGQRGPKKPAPPPNRNVVSGFYAEF